MSPLEFLRYISALIFVLALIGALAWLVRRFGLAGRLGMPTGQKRLSVIEVVALDARRRLVLVRRDSTEHLLLLGATGDLVVETRITAPSDAFANSLKAAEAEGERHSKDPVS